MSYSLGSYTLPNYGCQLSHFHVFTMSSADIPSHEFRKFAPNPVTRVWLHSITVRSVSLKLSVKRECMLSKLPILPLFQILFKSSIRSSHSYSRNILNSSRFFRRRKMAKDFRMVWIDCEVRFPISTN